MIMSRAILLTTKVSDKVCTENQNTYFMFKNNFENVPLWDNVWKYDMAKEVTDSNVILGQVIEQSQQYLYIYLK
jgi:hypothetical protein